MSKDITKYKNYFFASCPTGLEEMLEKEVKSNGIEEYEMIHGGAYFTAFPDIALKLLINSRIASRVYKVIISFDIKKDKDMYHQAGEFKWKSVFNLDQTFKIQTQLVRSPNGKKKSQFTNSIYLSQLLKDAIVDRFRKDTNGQRPSVDTETPDASLIVKVTPYDNEFASKEKVTVLLDLCGQPLTHRGYRQESFTAPLRENLAAGLIMQTDYESDKNFIDCMCGSGTFIAESLLMKGDIPPTYLWLIDYFQDQEPLPWDFIKQNFYTKDKYLIENFQKILKESYDRALKGFDLLKTSKAKTLGFDLSDKAIRITQDNLDCALLASYTEIAKADATKLKLPELDSGVLICNPPYGERIGELEELAGLYHDVGENLKQNFKGFNAYIIASNRDLLKKISLRADFKRIIYNGNIECRFVKYSLF